MPSFLKPKPNFQDVRLLAVSASFLALYIQLYIKLASGPWQTEQEGHGPFLLGAAAFIAYIEAGRRFDWLSSSSGNFAAGLPVLAIGLVFAVIGISQDITTMAAGSQPIVVAGLLIAYFGIPGIRVMIIPILLLVAATPPPSYLVDAITVHLKENISDAVVWLLYHLGFDIAQNGVIIQAGSYELLVKDACAGMNSIFALSALSIIYVYLRSEMPKFQKITLFICSLPIAVCSNFVRVLTLCLITYKFGLSAEDSAHDLTGILLFVVAGGLFFTLDMMLSAITYTLGAGRRGGSVSAASAPVRH